MKSEESIISLALRLNERCLNDKLTKNELYALIPIVAQSLRVLYRMHHEETVDKAQHRDSAGNQTVEPA